MIETAAWPLEQSAEDTFTLLQLVGGHSVPDPACREWTKQQRQEASYWAAMSHLHASDNEDVVVPPKPAHVAAYPIDHDAPHGRDEDGTPLVVCGGLFCYPHRPGTPCGAMCTPPRLVPTAAAFCAATEQPETAGGAA